MVHLRSSLLDDKQKSIDFDSGTAQQAPKQSGCKLPMIGH